MKRVEGGGDMRCDMVICMWMWMELGWIRKGGHGWFGLICNGVNGL